MTILLAILIFGALVMTHELGHFLFARKFGVSVAEFSIGMGPKLFGWTGKPDAYGVVTSYNLRLLPLGGYVSMEGEDGASDLDGAFCKKSVGRRALIVVAGACVNLLTGILCVLLLVGMLPNIGSTSLANPTAPFADGDRILEVDDTRVHIDYDLRYIIMRKGVQPIDILVERNGEEVLLEDVVFSTETTEGVTFAMTDFRVYREEKTFGTVLKHTYWRSVTTVRMIWESLYDLVTGKIGIEAMSGPVGVAGAISDAAANGFLPVLSMVSLLALNLGVMNLLPIPALDGGRLFFLLIEAIRRKPMKQEVEGIINMVGFVLLMSLLLFVTTRDIIKLF